MQTHGQSILPAGVLHVDRHTNVGTHDDDSTPLLLMGGLYERWMEVME